MSKPKPPPAPDYVGAARETAAGNLAMAKYQTEANRINQYTPWGSLTYTQSPDGKWSQYETLDPELQVALDSQIGVQRQLSDQANSMLGTVRSSYSQPFDAPQWNSYLQGVGGVDTSRFGPVAQFGSNATLTGLGQMAGPDQSGVGRAGTFDSGSRVASLFPFLNGVSQVDQSGQAPVGGFRSGAQINTDIAGALGSAQSMNQNLGRFSADGVQGLNQDFGRFAGGPGVNLNAPAFTNGRQDEYTRAAYEAQMNLLREDLRQQDEQTNNRLALQGLTPGSEASNNALATFQDGRSRQLNALANQSVLTGNELNQRDYASQLAGFRAGNEAVGQQFGQNLSQFAANQGAMERENAARGQAFGQSLNAFTTNRDTALAENQSRGQQFAQALQAFQAGNEAQGQLFGMDNGRFQNNLQRTLTNAQLQQQRNAAQQQAFDQGMTAFGGYNAAQGQQFAQDQGTYNTNLQGLQTNAALREADNAAQQQAFAQMLAAAGFNNETALQQFGMDQAQFDNALRTMQMQAALQQQYNASQQQAYAQALQNYGTNWQQAQTLRNMPLNELNALLNGQQIQNPEFENFAMQAQTAGPDLLGAAQMKGQWDTNIYNARMKSRDSMFGALGSIGGAILGAPTTSLFGSLFKK